MKKMTISAILFALILIGCGSREGNKADSGDKLLKEAEPPPENIKTENWPVYKFGEEIRWAEFKAYIKLTEDGKGTMYFSKELAADDAIGIKEGSAKLLSSYPDPSDKDLCDAKVLIYSSRDVLWERIKRLLTTLNGKGIWKISFGVLSGDTIKAMLMNMYIPKVYPKADQPRDVMRISKTCSQVQYTFKGKHYNKESEVIRTLKSLINTTKGEEEVGPDEAYEEEKHTGRYDVYEIQPHFADDVEMRYFIKFYEIIFEALEVEIDHNSENQNIHEFRLNGN